MSCYYIFKDNDPVKRLLYTEESVAKKKEKCHKIDFFVNPYLKLVIIKICKIFLDQLTYFVLVSTWFRGTLFFLILFLEHANYRN